MECYVDQQLFMIAIHECSSQDRHYLCTLRAEQQSERHSVSQEYN